MARRPQAGTARDEKQHQAATPEKEEVKVHYDKEGKRLIFQFVEPKSGELVRELPSKQVRSVAEAIEQRFEQAVSTHKTEEVSAAVHGEGRTHGHHA